MSAKRRKHKQRISPSRGSETARGRHQKSKGLRWQIFGSSQPPAFLLGEDHFDICMLLLLEAPVGAVVAVWAPGRTKGRKREQINSQQDNSDNRNGSDGKQIPRNHNQFSVKPSNVFRYKKHNHLTVNMQMQTIYFWKEDKNIWDANAAVLQCRTIQMG